jgi:hypothetical protein
MTNTHSSSTRGEGGSRRWTMIAAIAGAGAAGLLAAHSTAWAVGIGTAVGLFVAIREVLRP